MSRQITENYPEALYHKADGKLQPVWQERY